MNKFKTVLLLVLIGISMMNPDYKNGPNVAELAATPKEFTMTAFYEMKDGKPAPQYSLNAISVKKGDTVRIKITNTKGMHDFVIDEYVINTDLPLNQEMTIEFIADKAGTFTYYCSKPGHRAASQFGTLTVTE